MTAVCYVIPLELELCILYSDHKANSILLRFSPGWLSIYPPTSVSDSTQTLGLLRQNPWGMAVAAHFLWHCLTFILCRGATRNKKCKVCCKHLWGVNKGEKIIQMKRWQKIISKHLPICVCFLIFHCMAELLLCKSQVRWQKVISKHLPVCVFVF